MGGDILGNKNKNATLRAIGEEFTTSQGYELVDMEYEGGKEPHRITYYIYHPEGVNVDDCATISRKIENKLDELNLIDKSYYLEVSSPGLDRPLKTLDDYRRNKGKLVDIKLYGSKNGQKEFRGILKDFNDSSIVLTIDDNLEESFERDSIAMMRQSIIF